MYNPLSRTRRNARRSRDGDMKRKGSFYGRRVRAHRGRKAAAFAAAAVLVCALVFILAYPAIDRVIEGIEAVDAICAVRTDYNDKPRTPQVMKKVTVETFGVEYPEPIKC